jgi:uncharacterized repeat protein (TIGR03803 family)
MSNRKPRLGRFAKRLGPALAIAFVLLAITTHSVEAQTYTAKVLYSFTGPPDGQFPQGGLVLDPDGNLYGTTFGGGSFAGCYQGTCGTVFKLSANGTETILHSFSGIPDGANPQSVLVRDAKGDLYGTTMMGGKQGCAVGITYGCGTVFKIDPTGTETILHSFLPTGGDGQQPFAGLRRDKKGNLYGTTTYGGAYCEGEYGCGTVFKIDPTGTETVLYSFGAYYEDGSGPYSRLIGDGTGNLYGTTGGGGTRGRGTIFKLDAGTYAETILFNFCKGNISIYRCPYGKSPFTGVVLDAKGNIYGVTNSGGIGQRGVVYKISPAGKEKVLHRFGSQPGDGSCYCGDLLLDKEGNLYGINTNTVFKIDPTGTETILYDLPQTYNSFPQPSLVQDGQGNLYGVTFTGGDLTCNPPFGCGTVFKLTP